METRRICDASGEVNWRRVRAGLLRGGERECQRSRERKQIGNAYSSKEGAPEYEIAKRSQRAAVRWADLLSWRRSRAVWAGPAASAI